MSFLLTTLLNLIPTEWKQSRIGLLSIADQGMFSGPLDKLGSISPWTTILFLMLIPWFREAAWSLTALLSRSPAKSTRPTSVLPALDRVWTTLQISRDSTTVHTWRAESREYLIYKNNLQPDKPRGHPITNPVLIYFTYLQRQSTSTPLKTSMGWGGSEGESILLRKHEDLSSYL